MKDLVWSTKNLDNKFIFYTKNYNKNNKNKDK